MMKQLLTVSALAAVLLFARPVQAQQHHHENDSTKKHHMEMMHDSTMHTNMMGMCMNMMKEMMRMKNDSTHAGMMKDKGMADRCMKMCMKHMMHDKRKMDMETDSTQKNGTDKKEGDKNEERF